jgi:hypothetical protein
MRTLVAIVVSLLFALPAFADEPGAPAPASDTWSPLRVHVACQGWGRTKSCPAFLRGFIDESPALEWGTRASAQVVVYYNVTQVASDDMVHLRFTSSLEEAPVTLEVTQPVDSRGTDDEQRAQLKPAFYRAIAIYLGALVPEAVQTELIAPVVAEKEEPSTTPWGVSFWVGGWGSWTENYQSANTWGGASIGRLTGRNHVSMSVSGDYGLSRQPPLVIDDEEISLDVSSYSVQSTLFLERHLTDSAFIGGLARGGHQDPEGRYEGTWRAHVGIGYDWFASDDPRGNVLEVVYLAGYQVDDYNVQNVLKEGFAHFPTHGALIKGSVRKDKLTYGVHGSAMAMLFDPLTRYVVDIGPSMSVQLGDHVDVSFSVGVTKQAVPGPRSIDMEDFEEVTRSSYAEPLSLSAHFNLNIHWDRTNGERNNRWSVTHRLGALGTL